MRVETLGEILVRSYGQFQGGANWFSAGPEPQTFLSDLAKRVPIVFFSGNEDTLVGHRGTERTSPSFSRVCDSLILV